MPPVFGPVSPSPTRLWSCDDASGTHRAPVGERHERDLLAGQELLDHDLRPGRAERAPHHDLVETGARGREVVAHQHALPRREPVGLHDDRRADLVEVAPRRRVVVEGAMRGGRNAETARAAPW